MPPRKTKPFAHKPAAPESPEGRKAMVLDEAMRLIAERGVAGASLRELARRVGMQQPSLYHYFETKDDLVAQIVERCGTLMYTPPSSFVLPSTVAELPRTVRSLIYGLYEGERHPTFVRFMFVISIEKPEYRSLLAELFAERVHQAMRVLAGVFAEAEGVDIDALSHLLRMQVNAIGLPMIEERVLQGLPAPTPRLEAYVDFVVDQTEKLAALLPRSPRR